MGSLVSRPKLPKPQPVKIVTVSAPAPSYYAPPSPAATATTTPSSSSADSSSTLPEPTPEEVSTRAREENLLERRRGRLSTVLTGFRGLLNQSILPVQRKTLLGE